MCVLHSPLKEQITVLPSNLCWFKCERNQESQPVKTHTLGRRGEGILAAASVSLLQVIFKDEKTDSFCALV